MSAAMVLCFASAVTGSVVGVAGVAKRRRSTPHWAFLAGMGALALESLFGGMILSAAALEEAVFWQKLRTLAVCFIPCCWTLFTLTYARGDTRRWLPTWLPVLLMASCSVLVAALGLGERQTVIPKGDSPGSGIVLPLNLGGLTLNLLLLLCSVLVLVNLERTFRASVGTMRWRMKFVVIAVVVLFVVRIYTSSQAILYRAVEPSVDAPILASALLVACILMSWALVRSAFDSVAVYPSGEILRGSITLGLVGIYLLVVGALAKLLTLLGEYAGFPLDALLILVGLVGLSMVLTSDRIRQRTRRFVSRHFKRPVYDYRRTWMAFVEQTNSLMNEAELCRTVVKLAAETFEVLSLTIWLVDENQQFVFGASTSLLGGEENAFLQDPPRTAALTEALRNHPHPVELDRCEGEWVQTLRSCNPDFFRNGRTRICMPLVAQNEVLGLISLGDRVNGFTFSVEDADLLKCIGDQIAATLLNRRLSQKLLRARELEAFQHMSAFFVHDLKNTAHSLSLLLQNLPAHFDDPSFRQDAQRAVSNSVSHLNALIGRLTLLRQKLVITPKELELNAVVRSALASMHLPVGEVVLNDYFPAARVLADEGQIQKVLINLILNGREASGEDGKVLIMTEQRSGWAVLSVQDRGCGMSPEFINKSLFRPFQTTKKNGLGIGMFHSKTIVEAHGGKIEVESQMGKGTTVRLLLPCKQTKQNPRSSPSMTTKTFAFN